MNVPGLSLFQGGGSIQLNTSAQQRIEEEDDLEDRERRNAEVRIRIIFIYNSRIVISTIQHLQS